MKNDIFLEKKLLLLLLLRPKPKTHYDEQQKPKNNILNIKNAVLIV